MPVLPGADPYAADGGPVGVLLCHGFTGSPASMRPWGEHLAEAGLTVRAPRLPGHGTSWRELQLTRWPDWYSTAERELQVLQDRCESVFVMGLSVGGCLALRLAEQHGDRISGVVTVNASVMSRHRLLPLLPALSRVLPYYFGVVNDIAKPGQDEVGYKQIPLKAMVSLTELWQDTRENLAKVDQPILVMSSTVDHVVEAENAQLILDSVNSADHEYVELPDSYHVATLDYDAQTIFDRSLAFVRRLAPEAGPAS